MKELIEELVNDKQVNFDSKIDILKSWLRKIDLKIMSTIMDSIDFKEANKIRHHLIEALNKLQNENTKTA